MPMPDDLQRRYSEEEVSAILRLTMDKGEHEIQQDGMSLDELVHVAEEAGFAPDRIRSAAELLDTMDMPTKGIDLIGCRPYTEIVRVVDGKVTDENWDVAVAEMRSAFQGPTGSASELGKSREWYGGSEFSGMQVSLTPEEGRTRLKARLSTFAVPWLGYGMMTFIIGMAMTVVLKKSGMIAEWGGLMSSVFWVIAWLAAMGAMRWAIGSWYRKKTHQMKNALDRLQDVLSRNQDSTQTEVNVQSQAEEELRVQLGEAD